VTWLCTILQTSRGSAPDRPHRLVCCRPVQSDGVALCASPVRRIVASAAVTQNRGRVPHRRRRSGVAASHIAHLAGGRFMHLPTYLGRRFVKPDTILLWVDAPQDDQEYSVRLDVKGWALSMSGSRSISSCSSTATGSPASKPPTRDRTPGTTAVRQADALAFERPEIVRHLVGDSQRQ